MAAEDRGSAARAQLALVPDDHSVGVVEWRALGPVEVVVGGHAVNLGPPRQRAVFGFLLSRVDRLVAVDVLIDQLWSGHPPAAAIASLRTYVSNLRRVLEPARVPRTQGTVLHTRSQAYLLDSNGVELDVHKFAEFASAGRESLSSLDPQRAVTAFDAALRLWRGRAYADMRDASWAASEVTRLEELRLSVVEGRCEAALQLGDHHVAVAELDVHVREHPLREHGCALLALALYRAGRQADALEVLRDTRGRLTGELGIDPGAALRQLERDILAQSPTLDWHPPPSRLPQLESSVPLTQDGAPATSTQPPGSGRSGASPGRAKGPPRVWNVGPRNPGFVGRESTLALVRKRLRTGGKTVVQALHGLGGVGKTQVAIEYAHRYATDYDVVWWISAEETGLIGEQYAALAAELDLVPPHADTSGAVGVLRGYLRRNHRWLLLLDNAESPAELRYWLPAGNGHTLITSRNPGWEELAGRVEIDVLPRRDSVALIHVSQPSIDDAEADRLAGALEDLPLALVQGARFLAETGLSVERYLGLLATQAGELLDESAPASHPQSLAAVIRVSTDRLAGVDLAALAMLHIGAFLAPEPIPAELLTRAITSRNQPPALAALVTATASPVVAHRSLRRIGSYGLGRTERGLQLHRLTQAILRDQLSDADAEAYRSHAQALLVAADPGDERDPACWRGWARILPHLLAIDPATSASPELRDLACRAVWFLFYRGDNVPARDFAEHLHRQWSERLGPDDQHTLRVAYTLVLVLAFVGPHRQGCRLAEDTLPRCQRVFGDDHPITLYATHYFAICLHTMGVFDRARRLNLDAFTRLRRVLGEDHIDVWRIAHHLASDLRELGQVKTARKMHEDTLAYGRRVNGDDYPETIFAANDLGVDLYRLGLHDAARQLHQDTFDRARRVLGDDHLWTMTSAGHLARDLLALGETTAARLLSEETLTRARRVLGEEHNRTADVANTLAAALLAAGEAEAARQLSERTLTQARSAFAPDHPYAREAADILAAARNPDVRNPGANAP
jgi:DNA-binding SARP family transcriptional activator